jgi:short-subunit dehydrogenase
VPTRVIAQDLAAEGAAERVAKAVEDLEIGVLVNNAGFGSAGRFERVPLERHLGMIRVNCLAVTALTHLFLPRMRARGRGAIIIVASVAGYQPLGLAATYGATKAFDLMLGEALWAETRGTGIDVLALSPGPVETEFQAVAGEVPHPGATPESVVEAAVAALGRQPSVVAGTFNRLRTWGARLAPRSQVARVAIGVMRNFVPEAMR